MISRTARIFVAIVVAMLPVASATAAPRDCLKPPANPVFDAVSELAESLACNDRGYWEASFGAFQEFIFVPAGEFTRGSNDGLPDERPVRQINLDGYWIARYPVTVGRFREFVSATGYITDAERGWGSWQWTGERGNTPENTERMRVGRTWKMTTVLWKPRR